MDNPHEVMPSVDVSSHSDASRCEKCRAVAKTYQVKFDVTPLDSESLIQIQMRTQGSGSDLLLIDVRTKAERTVSQIPGSISLAESYDRLHAAAISGNRNLTVVTYCTMGYRSGIEAKAIQVRYPEITVFNLDGIVAYAHAIQKSREEGNGNGAIAECSLERLHTFGSQWAIAPSGVETVYFEGLELAGRMLEVKIRSLTRNVQNFLLWTSSRVSCRRRVPLNKQESET
jgi:rhodanese-related sulfurtransferase